MTLEEFKIGIISHWSLGNARSSQDVKFKGLVGLQFGVLTDSIFQQDFEGLIIECCGPVVMEMANLLLPIGQPLNKRDTDGGWVKTSGGQVGHNLIGGMLCGSRLAPELDQLFPNLLAVVMGILLDNKLASGGLDAADEDRVHELLFELEDFLCLLALGAIAQVKDICSTLSICLGQELFLEHNNLFILLESGEAVASHLIPFLKELAVSPLV